MSLTAEDIGEMHMVATAALGIFPRVEVDPEHLIALCRLARDGLQARRAIEDRIERAIEEAQRNGDEMKGRK